MVLRSAGGANLLRCWLKLQCAKESIYYLIFPKNNF